MSSKPKVFALFFMLCVFSQGCGDDKTEVPALSFLLSGYENSPEKMSEDKAKELVDFMASVLTTIDDLEPYLGVPRAWGDGVYDYRIRESKVLFLYTDRERYGDLVVAAKLALLVERKPSGDAILEDYTTIYKRQIKTASDLER
jgi:hypothetical protein